MGFSSVIENSYDSIGNIDFNTESATAVMLTAIDLGRVVTDLILWATEEMHMIRVADGYISTSSIMPQKRNPIALEHLRSSLSVIKGICGSVLDGYTKTPYGDISDHEDIQPMMMKTFELLEKNIRILRAVIATLDVDKDLLWERAHESFSVVTEMADTLVRITDLPFRTAHHVVSDLVKNAEKLDYNLKEIDEDFFRDSYRKTTGKEFDGPFEELKKSMDPIHFVTIRNVYGGTGPDAMNQMLENAEKKLEDSVSWLAAEEKKLDNSSIILETAIKKICE